MFETCRMLGEQREAELLREAQRLHAGQAVKDAALRKPRRRLVFELLRSAVVPLRRLQGSATHASSSPVRSLSADGGDGTSIDEEAAAVQHSRLTERT